MGREDITDVSKGGGIQLRKRYGLSKLPQSHWRWQLKCLSKCSKTSKIVLFTVFLRASHALSSSCENTCITMQLLFKLSVFEQRTAVLSTGKHLNFCTYSATLYKQARLTYKASSNKNRLRRLMGTSKLPQVVTFLTSIQEMTHVNLIWDTSYTGWGFPQSFKVNTGRVCQLRPQTLPSKSLQFCVH